MNFSSRNSNFSTWSKDDGGQHKADASSNPLFAPGLNNGPSVLNSSVKIRLSFLRKVYGILSIQLALTTLVSVVIMLTPSIHGYLFRNSWILIFNFLANIVSIFALMFKRNEYPTNFYLLGAFTFFNSISVGVAISLYELDLVIQAFFLTTSIVIGLTLYTLNSKSDFTWLRGSLSSLVMVSFIGTILHLFIGNSFTETLLCVFGAFIFSAYIIYDTQMIMKHLSAEEYIVGVINLYVDIINLFLKLLRLLELLKGEERKKDKRRR